MKAYSRNVLHALNLISTYMYFFISFLYFPEMGVMPEIGQAVEEMDWR
jgi:hypothetical protein